MPYPTPNNDENDIERQARRRAGAKLGWYVHAAVFTLVNLALWTLSHHAFGSRPWSVYPLLGWGLGLAMHAVAVFLLGRGSTLHQRMVERERAHLLRARGPRQH